MKTCSKCKESKREEEYWKDASKKCGLSYACSDCERKKIKKWSRGNWYRNEYGITMEKWDEIFVSQNKRCAICNTKDPGHKSGWNLDHDHRTKQVRGILCATCNRNVLPVVEDRFHLIKRCQEYLFSHFVSNAGEPYHSPALATNK